ncbi:hypothetical protein [Enterocloster citroniae]|uniref:hypothetical protein n=1 Tax=Enterocloster citroniae TaxID=358743 RepID=UPI00349ECA6D
MKRRVLCMLLVLAMAVTCLAGCNRKKSVRVVIGSSSTSGDSYLIADTVTRYLAEEMGWDAKVDPVGAAEMFEILRTDKGKGDTIAIFHDMMYLGVVFGTYGEEYALENITVGPRVAQNPGCCFAAKADAPYSTMVEAAEYLKVNPDAEIRVACENGSVSTLCYLAYYNWVLDNYGQEVADQLRVIAAGVTSEKRQMLWDGNVDIIFDDYYGIQQYVGVDDKQLAMKCVGLLDEIEGAENAPTYAEQGITFNNEPFSLSKDFLVYYPQNIDAEFAKAVDAAAAKVCENANFQSDMAKLNYRGAYLDSAAAKEFIYNKRTDMTQLIEACPDFDYLTQ